MNLDMCCGSRMFWFNKKHPDTIYMDIRNEDFIFPDRIVRVRPDVVGDFRKLPFAESVFDLCVFDPPHLRRAGIKSWLRAKYGVLNRETWQEDLKTGFREAFRVLRPGGILIFKWNDDQIPLSDVLPLAEITPLLGSRHGRRENTSWIVFQKDRSQ